jgi:hypothetical protein
LEVVAEARLRLAAAVAILQLMLRCRLHDKIYRVLIVRITKTFKILSLLFVPLFVEVIYFLFALLS